MAPAGPRLAEPGEFDEIAALLNRCFGFDVPARMPHCFDPDHLERHAVIVDDGAVVSHVACVPVELVAGDARVDCRGIAGVATDEDHRGNGYMDALLSFWLERMDERGVPLAELEGDRVRYGRYGWENAGGEYRYALSARSFAATYDVARDSRVEQYAGADAHLDLLKGCHESERFRVARDRAAYETLLSQSGLETLVRPDAPAYLCYRGDDPASVLEFGGDAAGVRTLLGHLLADGDVDGATLYAHPRHPHNETFRRASDGWTLLPHRKLNVRDLAATLSAFLPLLEERWDRARCDAEGAITLGVEGGSAATLSYAPGEVAVRPAEGDPDVALSRTEMTQLLFGFPDQWRTIRRQDPLLSTALPLEYYFWETETI